MFCPRSLANCVISIIFTLASIDRTCKQCPVLEHALDFGKSVLMSLAKLLDYFRSLSSPIALLLPWNLSLLALIVVIDDPHLMYL